MYSLWLHKNRPILTIWRNLDSHKNISPITQSYGICFTKDGLIVLTRHGSDSEWNLPGGTPEEGETYEETLIREVDEEADIDVSNIKLLGAAEVFDPFRKKKKVKRHHFQLRYFALVENVRELTLDPDNGLLPERKLIKPEEFYEYIKWGPIGKTIFKKALAQFNSYK